MKMKGLEVLLTAGLVAVNGALLQGTPPASDPALQTLIDGLSHNAAVSFLGHPLQNFNAQRYWGVQYAKNASVVIFPANSNDVSLVMQALPHTPLRHDFAFVGGGHGQTNASSAYGMVMDLSYLNNTAIVHNFTKCDGTIATAIMYGGGCHWEQVYNATAGSGYAVVGARDSHVGVGGFSTGGGIGFLAGAYGFATDRLLAMDVVLPSGQQVMVTEDNEHVYSDLFWALHGGGGQFCVVTAFYQEAIPEPTISQIGVYFIEDGDVPIARANAVAFSQTNIDPFSLIYFAPGYLPPSLTSLDPSSFGLRTCLVALRFKCPDDPQQPTYSTTFAPLLAGLNTSNSHVFDLPYTQAPTLVNPFFPYDYRRGFWGPQIPAFSVDYLANVTDVFNEYVNHLLARGESPLWTVFVLQYMFPALNGKLPPADYSTAWPHATVGHQTLFSPGWTKARDDGLAETYVERLNKLAYAMQREQGVRIADYPNYISPQATGRQVWGKNLRRLEHVKEKYDPECLIRQGRVFRSQGCMKRGFGNL